MTYLTRITQYRVKILPEKDHGYAPPGKGWDLVEYLDRLDGDGRPLRAWTPKYSLRYSKIEDHSKVRIVEDSK